MPEKKPSVGERIIKGLNTTASVIGAATSLGKTAYAAAKFAAPIVKAIIRMIGNPKSWYLKYGPVTPAANENRPMEPIFNTLLTKNATFGVPHFVDVEVSWTDFANTYMMDQVVTNAMRSIRKHLRSNLPYDDQLVKAYLVCAVALSVMAKQVERDVHWAQYTATNNPRWQAMYIKKARVTGKAGIVDLIDEDYLSDANWAYTSSIYNKFRDLYNNTVFEPAALGEFISHYFGSLFVSSTDGHNDQYIRLKMQEIDWMEQSEDGWVTTKLNVSNLTLDDVMKMLNKFSKQFAIVIADLEKAVSLSATSICSYEEYAYYLVYDESLLQALINGYTTKTALTNKDYVRLDRMAGVEDDLTQFLFMGALQPEDSSLSNTKAIRILSMTYKLDSNEELEWPAEFTATTLRDGASPVVFKGEPFGLQLVSDVVVENVTDITASTSEQTKTIVLTDQPTESLEEAEVSLYLSTTRGRRVNSGTFTKSTINGRIVNTDKAVVYWFLPQAITYVGELHPVFTALVVTKTVNSTAGQLGPTPIVVNPDNAKLIVFDLDSFSIEAASKFRIINDSGICGITNYADGDDEFENAIVHALTNDSSSVAHFFEVLNCFASTGYAVSGVINSDRAAWSISFTAECMIEKLDATIFADNIFENAGAQYKAFYGDGVLGVYYAVAVANTTTSLYQSSMVTSLSSVAAYAADVFDYHIPFVVRSKYIVRINGTDDLKYESNPVLVKENYVPYFYNILDLIPVLYSMFTSLFSFEGRRNDWGRKPKDRKDKTGK